MKLSKIVCLIALMLCFSSVVFGLEYKEGIENFPESYRPYLYALQEKHTNWKFTAMYTGLDWNKVTTEESHLSTRSNRLSVSLSPSSWNKAWHYFLENGSTNRVEQGWVTASSNSVKFTMDPRNFLNDETIFQFEELTYNEKIHTLQGVEQILYGTEMSKAVTENGVTKYVIKDIEYYKPTTANNLLKTTATLNLRKTPSVTGDYIKTIEKNTTVTTLEYSSAVEGKRTWAKIKLSDGTEGYACRIDEDGSYNLVDAGTTTLEYVKYIDVEDLDGDGSKEDTLTYAEAYMIAAKTSGVSPYALALRTKNETGCKITSNGQIYGQSSAAPGYYNYYSIGAYGANPMENGVIYAKNKGWDNPVKAIVEGASFWGKEYILAKQNTPYLQKYNVNVETKNGLYTHQYMTDITCVYREALGMYDTYKSMKILDNDFTFIIPVYNNMPEEPYHIYVDYDGYFEKEEDTITTNKVTAIYSLIPTSAGVTRVEMVSVPTGTKLTKLASGMASTYDRVKYKVDGADMYGFVFYTNYDLTKTEDNTKMEVIASPWVRLRSEPNTASSQITILYTGDIVTRIEKNSATNSSGVWDKVVTESGKIGYVCRVYKDGADVYLKEMSYKKVEGIAFGKELYELVMSDTLKVVVNITPIDAKYKDVTFTSSDESIAKIDNSGVITPLKAGEVTITAKTIDQLKKATCKVVVKPCINIDKDAFKIVLGESVKPIVEVLGLEENKYTVTIKDESVIKYEEEKFMAVAIGKTTAEIKAVADETLIKTVEIEVIEKPEIKEETKLSIKLAEELKINNNVLTGIKLGATISDIKLLVSTNGTVKFLDKDKKEITEGIIGTGVTMVITLDEESHEYSIVIYGDVNGDGKISPSDYVKVKNKILGKENVDGCFELASDVNHDGKISPSDYVKIKNCIMGKESIEQADKIDRNVEVNE